MTFRPFMRTTPRRIDTAGEKSEGLRPSIYHYRLMCGEANE